MCSETRRRFAKKTAFLVLAVAGVAAFGAGGCGKQGDPMPPVRDVPAPTRDLAVRQQGNRILLDFAFPNLTPAGTTLGGLSGVEILALSRDAPSQGKPAPIEPRELAGGAAAVALRLETGDIAPSTVGDRLVIGVPLTEPLPAAPQARYYAVRTIGPKGDPSEISNVVAIVPKTPPAAPERITVTPVAEGVRVEWTAREGAAGYNVYRRGSQERGYSRSLQAGPEETSFVDTTAVFGQDYIYTVTAVAERDPLIESAVGSEYEVRYQDRFPPPPPADLVALAEGGQVRLIWRPAEGEDPAGYLVYRREQDGELRRVTDQPVQETEFLDTSVAAGRPYFYRVTAVDALGNESAPGNEVATRLR